MNVQAFKQNTDQLISIIGNSSIPEKEKNLRTKRINDIFKKMYRTDSISEEYYQRAHEIRSFEFLNQFGNVEIALDSEHQPGCDFTLNNRYLVECVCCSKGDPKNGLEKYCIVDVPIDYSKKRTILNTRLTQALEAKCAFYQQRKGNSIPLNKPYIILLGLGGLTEEYFAGEYGISLTDVLFGRGYPQLKINSKTSEIISSGYTHNEKITKWNDTKIDCNLFSLPRFAEVSAILFSIAGLVEAYSFENTWMFINPFANLTIKKKDFSGLVYWSANRQNYYIARRRGRAAKFNDYMF